MLSKGQHTFLVVLAAVFALAGFGGFDIGFVVTFVVIIVLIVNKAAMKKVSEQNRRPPQQYDSYHTTSPAPPPFAAAPAPYASPVSDAWSISISFGKSSSQNYQKAVALAKAAPYYHEQTDDGHILHQAVYSAAPQEYLAFVMLYELVGSWKSAFVFINGNPVDRKIIGQLNYCYGDRCRSAEPAFCFGASSMTTNVFGCHRIQISACNHPLWMFYRQQGRNYVLDRAAVLQRINEAAATYSLCPCFHYAGIMAVFNKLPSSITARQREALIQETDRSLRFRI